MKESALLHKLLGDQLSVWPLASANYRSLKAAGTKTSFSGGIPVTIQLNPGRKMRSVTADCHLCGQNRPKEQQSIKFEARKGRKYEILVNPYPIFQEHFTVASLEHTPQTIFNRFVDMTDLAHHYIDFTFFYNGPDSGASAAGHMHFQACPRAVMPLEVKVDEMLDNSAGDGNLQYLCSVKEAQLYHCDLLTSGVYVMKARTAKSLTKLFYRLLDCTPLPEGAAEPMFNLLMWYKPLSSSDRPKGNTHGLADFEYRAVVMLRRAHRPACFYEQGESRLNVSPGCAEMAGFMVTTEERDFGKIDSGALEKIYADVSVTPQTDADVVRRLTRTQENIQVGVLAADKIVFEIISDGAGPQTVSYKEGKINYNGSLYDELFFDAQTPSKMFAEPTFILYDVVIGVDFHWERKMTGRFGGSLKFIVEKGKVVAVNVIGVEDYLLSVISSEMKSSASLEFLKAHAVISRSWVLAQMASRHRRKTACPEGLKDLPAVVTDLDTRIHGEVHASSDGEIIKWYDHEDHINFDVCADDHCQRYQGLTMAVGRKVRQAIDLTWGEVLMSEGRLCDCRFHKCCGSRTELFSTCWDDVDFKYLPSLRDSEGHKPEEKCFCDTSDEEILSQVLNDFDRETKDFFHWKVSYTREEVSSMFAQRSGIDLGLIRELIPIEKGPSGVIKKLKVVGDKGSVTIGKELIVRKFLSKSHLKSARFTPAWEGDTLILDGYGWGHGVGLCQIGAAVMACKGYGYKDILEHYYPGTELKTIDTL